jgi:hypothetical protein
MKYIIDGKKIDRVMCLINEMMVSPSVDLVDEMKVALNELKGVKCPDNGRVTFRDSEIESTILIEHKENP